MTEWKKICCAVDFGEPSRMALFRAADSARRFEGELTLVHVAVPPVAAASDVLVSSRVVVAGEAGEHQELLAQWKIDAEARLARPVRTLVLTGDPARQLVRHAREEQCDLVVVGTHGRTGLSRAVLGSVAERIARSCPCPVLVVHDDAALEKDAAAEEAAQYR